MREMNNLNRRHRVYIVAFFFGASSYLIPGPALAYIGPGVGLGAVAVTVGLVLGAVLLMGGFVWYPLKRLLRNKKKEKGNANKAGK